MFVTCTTVFVNPNKSVSENGSPAKPLVCAEAAFICSVREPAHKTAESVKISNTTFFMAKSKRRRSVANHSYLTIPSNGNRSNGVLTRVEEIRSNAGRAEFIPRSVESGETRGMNSALRFKRSGAI